MSLGPIIKPILTPIKEAVTGAIERAAANPEFGSMVRQSTAGALEIPQIWDNAFRRAGNVMKGWGGTAAQLADTLEQTHKRGLLNAGTMWEKFAPFEKVVKNGPAFEHFVDVAEGKAVAKDQVTADLVRLWRETANQISDESQMLDLKMVHGPKYWKAYEAARSRGESHMVAAREGARAGMGAPFEPLPNYWPRYYPDTVINEAMYGKQSKKLMQKMVDLGFANADARSARAILERTLRMPSEFRGGPLTHARTALDLPGYDKSWASLKRYLYSSSKRLESARAFGADDSKALAMIEQAASENPKVRTDFLTNVYAGFMDGTDPRFRDLARLTGTIHSLTLLSTTGLLQPAQLTNTIGAYGWGNTIKAITTLLKDPEMRTWAHSTGATMETISNELLGGGLSDLSKAWMSAIGLERLDKTNRMVSAVAGALHAQDLANKLRVNPLSSDAKHWVRNLSQLGLDPQQIMQRGGQLLPEELKQAGLSASLKTQFGSQAFDLPVWKNTPMGRFMYMFKSFGLQQSYFLKSLVDEARQGNRAPLIRYAAVVAPVGLLYGPGLRAQKGLPDPEDMQTEVLEDMARVGAGGALFDAWRAVDSGPQAIANLIGGPSFGEVTQLLGADVPPLVKEGNVTPLTKHIVRRTPVLGPWLANTWFGD